MARTRTWLCVLAMLWASSAFSAPLTADDAVRLALVHNADAIGAEAGVVEARGGLYSAYSGVLPSVSASLVRTQSKTLKQPGTELVPELDQNGNPTGNIRLVPVLNDITSNGTTPQITGSLPLLNLSSWAGVRSASHGLQAARQTRLAARSDVALSTRRQFYEVVKDIKLATVAAGALQLARDDERRVRALFEVGSVSKSDLLKAQVATAQSELDELSARNLVLTQRIALAELIGVKEDQLGEVDTLLAMTHRDFDEASLVAEANRNRPDVRAADLELSSARSAHVAARMARLPYVTIGGSMSFSPRSDFTQVNSIRTTSASGSSDRILSARVALQWDFFSGLAQDSRIAAAQGRVLRAEQAREAAVRNVGSDVRAALLAYHEAVERDSVARRALESATENLKLTQEKYNVGSATILELIDAQVQLQRAQSDGVSALAAIRQAEAQIDRARGRAE